MCGKERVEIIVAIPRSFPDELPKVYLTNTFQHFPIPHVDSDRNVCTFDTEVIEFFSENAGKLVSETIEKARTVISEGLSGRNEGDYEEEFLAYWRSDSGSSLIYSILEPPEKICELQLAELTNDLHKIRWILGNNKKQIASYVRNLNGSAAIRIFKPCLFLPLPSMPLPPFPKTHRDILELLREMNPALENALAEFLSSKDHEGTIICAGQVADSFVLVGWEHTAPDKKIVVKGFRPGKVNPRILEERMGSQKIRKLNIQRIDSKRLQGRIGGSNASLRDKKVCLVGLGSLGSQIAFILARAGVEEMILVDDDLLRPENVARHLCGMSEVGLEKVATVSKRIQAHFPQVKIACFSKQIHEVLMDHPDPVVGADLLISATGNTAMERRLNDLQLRDSQFPQVLYSWIEPYGIASHAVLIFSSIGGCFECCLDPETLKFDFSAADFGAKESTMREVGCQTTFSPYSALDSEQAASIAARLALAFLSEELDKSTRYTWLGDLDLIGEIKTQRSRIYAGKPSFSLHKFLLDKREDCTRCR